MPETRTNAKGEIVIPASMCRKFGIAKGTRIRIEVEEKDNKIILTPITRARMQKLCGIFMGTDLLGALASLRGVTLRALFGPEHGMRGEVQNGLGVAAMTPQHPP